MMGERAIWQEALFYGFDLDDHVPADHLLRSIDRFVELTGIRRELAPYYSAIGRPSIDPEEVAPKFISPTDPAARWTAATGGPACFAYCDNYLIELEHAVIVDVETTTVGRQAEVGAAQTMLTRTAERFGLWPERLVADTGYGSAAMLAWLVHEQGIEPHIPVFDKSTRTDGTFSPSWNGEVR